MKINEKNLCIFACSPPYDKEGFLNKRGEVNKAFQRRYFVLKGNLLFYFEKKGDKEPLGLIIVEGCTIELSEESDQYCFEIAFNGNRTYVLSADSQENMESWMKALTCAGYEYKKLIVAELQRKLNEIENSKKMTNESMITLTNPSMPKPPPRRQNPFNRPAPPPPPIVNCGNAIVNPMLFVNDHYSVPQPSTSAALQLDLTKQSIACPKPPPRNTMNNTSNIVTKRSEFYVKPQSSTSQPQLLLGESSNAIKTNSNSHRNSQSSPVENINNCSSFEERHEKFRELIMKDVIAYHKERELRNRPLIEL